MAGQYGRRLGRKGGQAIERHITDVPGDQLGFGRRHRIPIAEIDSAANSRRGERSLDRGPVGLLDRTRLLSDGITHALQLRREPTL